MKDIKISLIIRYFYQFIKILSLILYTDIYIFTSVIKIPQKDIIETNEKVIHNTFITNEEALIRYTYMSKQCSLYRITKLQARR